ncbi:hypothetical protein [Allofustis seminis]|uniref:hypothetical protein n=1 Tax=Allofustis seminis TaxID=166939 RepID=UPI00037E6B5E|nr:hypothetical protein [Allofustis seminis]
MKLKNEELLALNMTVFDMKEKPIKGALKFKVFKLAKELPLLLEPLQEVLEDEKDKKMIEEIMKEEQDVSLPTFTQKELEDVELSISDLFAFEKLIQEEV